MNFKAIPLTRGQVTIVSPEDYELLMRWKWQSLPTPGGRFYAVRGQWENGRTISVRMQRVIMGLERGDKRQVDHANLDTLDNRRENLRIASPTENVCNKRGWASSGLKGAYSHQGRWRSLIRLHGKTADLGCFDTAEEAHAAYCVAAEIVHRDFHRTNHRSDPCQ